LYLVSEKQGVLLARRHKKNLVLTGTVLAVLAGCDSSPSRQPLTSSEPEPVVIANRQPYFNQPDQLQIPEQVRAVTQLSALDLDGDQLSYSILGGPDAQLFDLSPDGTLLFSQAPDFELPSDSDADNSYQLSVGVSDGMATDSMALSIEVRDRFEGRVVDDPVAGAAVFVDLNNNHQQDDNEPSAVSDSQGYFVLNSAVPDNAAGSMLVSKGGINTHSNFPVPNLVLMAEVSGGTGGALVVTPLSTVLAGVQSNTERQQLLQQLGIDQPVSGLLSTDPWKAAIEGQPAALAIQRTNEQLALLAITLDCLLSLEAGVDAMALTVQLNQSLVSRLLNGDGSLLEAETLQDILHQSYSGLVNQQPSIELLAPGVLEVVSGALARINSVFANSEVNPTSDLSAELRSTALPALESAIKDLL
jgi:hypothetical protein